MKKSLQLQSLLQVATIAIAGHGHEAHAENKDIIQMIQLHTATLTLSTNKVTIITLGKVTGAQIK